MPQAKALFLFYKKEIIPAVTISIALSILLMEPKNLLKGIAIAYFFCAPFCHYYAYEMKHSSEYYFYYNLGLSKLKLWLFAIAMNALIGISLILISFAIF